MVPNLHLIRIKFADLCVKLGGFQLHVLSYAMPVCQCSSILIVCIGDSEFANLDF